MPNIKSAKKRVVVNEKKNLENRMVKSTVKTAISANITTRWQAATLPQPKNCCPKPFR